MILHIPHSGINTLGRNIEAFDIAELTDWHTDKNDYPDFCIGTTEQTPIELVDLVSHFLKNYTVTSDCFSIAAI